jgi:hypothetical protein
MKNGRSRRFYQSKRFWLVAAAVVIVAMVAQGPFLSFVVRQFVERGMAQQGLAFRADSLRAAAFAPVVIEGISIRPAEQGRGGPLVHMERLEIVWSGPGRFLSGWRNWVHSVTADGVNVVMDLRRPEKSIQRDKAGFDDVASVLGLFAPGGAWPSIIEIRNGSAEVLGENFRHVLDGLDLSLNSEAHGRLRLETLTVQAGKFNKVFGPFTAPTTWEQGNASLAGLDLVPGITLSDVSLRLGSLSGPSLSFSARVFGGALRGDVNLSKGPRGKFWDIAAFGSNIAVDDLPALLDLSGKARGTLAEGRFTFRGDAGRPVDAESSLRVLAKDFRWNDRGWDSLEIGASLIHRRLLISNFDLRQKDNKVTMNGEISLAEGWSKISESPFLANIRANIKELDSLAGLLGGPLGQTSGQLTAEGSVSGRPGSLDGFLGIRANGVVCHSVPVERMNLEILFRKKQIDLVRCEMVSGKDALNAKGTVDLAAPHAYSAELNATLAEVATYLRPFYDKGDGAVSGGAMGIRWKGKGAVNAHSGEFDVDLSRFASSLTPAGLTGHFVGFYSPESLYFSELDLENGNTHLRTRATVSSTGLTLEGLELTDASKPLLSGSAFLPVDALAILRGADWKAAVLQSGDMYVRANTPAEIDLRDLLRLAGQDRPLSGLVKMQLEASGPPSRPNFNALVKGRDMAFGGGNVPPSTVEIDLKTQAGGATLNGKVESAGMAPAVIKATFPLALSQDKDGTLRWIDSHAPFQADIEMPRLDLALARPILPFLHKLRGEISGHAKINNTSDALKITGEAEVRATSFGFEGLAAGVEALHGKIAVVDGVLLFQNIEGEVGRGRFAMEGSCEFAEPWKPKWDLRWRADRVPLASHAALALLATGELQAVGSHEGGALSGKIGFEGSLIHGAFSLQALLSQKPASVPNFPLAARILSKLTPSADWLLDVKIDGGSGVEVRGGRFSAFLAPDLRLVGTAGQPLPVGHILLSGIDAGGFFIESGELFFLADEPWNPFLLVEGEGWFANRLIHAFAFGPLSECKWILSSSEDLGQSPQDFFLAVENGWSPITVDGMTPLDMKLYEDSREGVQRVVSSRIEADSVWRNGVKFSESMDFAPGVGIFPIDSFRSGFEWRLDPVF